VALNSVGKAMSVVSLMHGKQCGSFVGGRLSSCWQKSLSTDNNCIFTSRTNLQRRKWRGGGIGRY